MRKPGWYWCQWDKDGEWECSEWRGYNWDDNESSCQPVVVGERIPAPDEPVAEEVTLFECVSCNHLYQDQVTRCDCMPEEQKFNRWLARPERAEQKPDVAAAPKPESQP